jgi:hypothetical protein
LRRKKLLEWVEEEAPERTVAQGGRSFRSHVRVARLSGVVVVLIIMANFIKL